MPSRESRLVLERFLPYRLVALAQNISTALSAIYHEQFGISIAEWRILANLAEKGELSPGEIAQQTSMDKARVTRALKELRGKQCLVQKGDEHDRRAYRLRLSARGLALYRRIVPLALDWEAELLGALDAAEYRDLLHSIDKLAARAQALRGSARGREGDGAQVQ